MTVFYCRVVKSGQLEITGGAWVMTDEATPFYWAAIDNLIEGHQFLDDQLHVRPKTSWSVDPFGHGGMMPYLLRLAGVEKMAVGRINNAIKEMMRERQQLVFRSVNRVAQLVSCYEYSSDNAVIIARLTPPRRQLNQ